MRNVLFILTLVLAACGDTGSVSEAMREPVQHEPVISNVTLSPDSAFYMEGDGSVQVTVGVFFTDIGRDIETLQIAMSDGTSLAIPVSTSLTSVSGTLTEVFDVTTADVQGYTIEIWVVDKAGQSSNHLNAAFPVIKHTPEILNVNISPDSAAYMEGGGTLVVSAEVTFMDAGQDIQTLRVLVPDGTRIEFDEVAATDTGVIAADFPMSTEKYGEFTFSFQLVDKTGIYSSPIYADFNVIWNTQESDWTNRLAGLPYVLADVIWDGDVFIAVGAGGSIVTSADGIDWAEKTSGTAADIYRVAAYGPDIIAVGDEIVLLSTDHGETWLMKNQPAGVRLSSVIMNSSQVVVGGWIADTLASSIMISEDRGDTWQTIDSQALDQKFLYDLMYREGLFVAAVDSPFSIGGGWIFVSTDGAVWNEIYRDLDFGLNVVVHDGNQFIVAGRGGAVRASIDGFNWTEAQTPVEGVDYLSATWNGSKLVLAGGYACWHFHYCDPPQFDLPVGLASTAGGVSWEAFNIDGQYQSLGLAFGNGRLVSVGQSAPMSGEGAIYTAD